MTNRESNEFNTLFCALQAQDKETFKNINIKLLKVNFLLKKTDNDQYLFILNNKELFKYFFDYLNFSFEVRQDRELAYIKSNNDSLINTISKNETLGLLVLRLLYQEHLSDVSLSDDIEVTSKEFQEKLFSVGFQDKVSDRIRKSTLNDMLRTFKQHNIVYYNETSDLQMDNTIITIYPSIEVAVDFKSIDEVLNRLNLLKGVDDTDD